MIETIQGDLFKYIPENPQQIIIIPHVVNNIGAWGSGFVVPLGGKYPKCKEHYLNNQHLYQLGDTCTIWVDPNIFVANMCAQNELKSASNPVPLKYEHLVTCMVDVRDYVMHNIPHGFYSKEIWCPMFGSDRAGGDWNLIYKLIEEIWEPHFIVKVFKYGR